MFFKKMFYTYCVLMFVSGVNAQTKTQVIYVKPIGNEESKIATELHDSQVISDVLRFIDQQLILSEPLFFQIGALDGPLYDSNANTIYIPYQFISSIKRRFSQENYTDTSVNINQATMDALMYTLFHELAHALIFNYNIPVLGKEEDAADSLANVLLIEFFASGAEIVLNAAELFMLESEDIEVFDEQDFWGEHSLDAQRSYTAFCHVYGSNPSEYAYLKQEIGFADSRAKQCIEEYENIARSWFELLDPYFNLNP